MRQKIAFFLSVATFYANVAYSDAGNPTGTDTRTEQEFKLSFSGLSASRTKIADELFHQIKNELESSRWN
ncbi:hypothetical protein N9D31_03860, partial [Oligoflexaceae bacterium]|nr:hypothetical protein [Oligoflexaceae bacterium]